MNPTSTTQETNEAESQLHALREAVLDQYAFRKQIIEDWPDFRENPRPDEERIAQAAASRDRLLAVLDRQPTTGFPTPVHDQNATQNGLDQGAMDSRRLAFLIKTKLAVKQMKDTGLFMMITVDDHPVTGEEFDTPYEAIDALMASDEAGTTRYNQDQDSP